MKKYTAEELAHHILGIIKHNYNSPEAILITFKTNIRRKVKALSLKELTENELEINSLKIANSIYNNLYRISSQIIINTLSTEMIGKANNGVNILDEKDYFLNFAKEMVKKLLEGQYKLAKKQFNQNVAKMRKRK